MDEPPYVLRKADGVTQCTRRSPLSFNLEADSHHLRLSYDGCVGIEHFLTYLLPLPADLDDFAVLVAPP